MFLLFLFVLVYISSGNQPKIKLKDLHDKTSFSNILLISKEYFLSLIVFGSMLSSELEIYLKSLKDKYIVALICAIHLKNITLKC